VSARVVPLNSVLTMSALGRTFAFNLSRRLIKCRQHSLTRGRSLILVNHGVSSLGCNSFSHLQPNPLSFNANAFRRNYSSAAKEEPNEEPVPPEEFRNIIKNEETVKGKSSKMKKLLFGLIFVGLIVIGVMIIFCRRC